MRFMRVESDGHSRGNPRLYEAIEAATFRGSDPPYPPTGPKTNASGAPTVWAWPQIVDFLKVAGQPVAGPWPPHQEPRPDPDYESGPVAIPDPATEAP